MLIDFLSQDNYNQYNISLAHLIGLENAIYINELLNIYRKAVRKNKYKVVDSNNFNSDDREIIYFSVDRTYIEERTTLSAAKQLSMDTNLINMNIMSKNENNSDEICIDVEYLASIFADKNKKVVKTIVNTVKPNKSTKKEAVAEALKLALKTDDTEMYDAYKAWVDAVLANPKAGTLSTGATKIFRDTLTTFANGNRNALIDMIKIATLQGWKTPEWAIDAYKKNNKIHKDCTMLTAPVVTNQTKIDISKYDLF